MSLNAVMLLCSHLGQQKTYNSNSITFQNLWPLLPCMLTSHFQSYTSTVWVAFQVYQSLMSFLCFIGGPMPAQNSPTVQEEAEREKIKNIKMLIVAQAKLQHDGSEEYSTCTWILSFLSVPHQNIQLLAACEWSGMFITNKSARLNRFSPLYPPTHNHTLSHSSASYPVSSTTKGLLPPPTIINQYNISFFCSLIHTLYTAKVCGHGTVKIV